MSMIYPGHYLMGCRLDNWLRLLWENRFRISREKIPEALAITASSAALFPFALAESAIFDKKIRSTPLEKAPIFIVGHWRSGTTYLQNLLTQDTQFGFADPVSATAMPNSYLLGRLASPMIARLLKNARPMDNMEYTLSSPMEETFALLTVSDLSVIHMLAFPENYRRYMAGAFVDDLPRREQVRWERTYDFVLRKISLAKGGKQLVLKSPDNTAHLRQLMGMYPDARYINIHRDPYAAIRSTIHMFKAQLELMRLSPLPEGDLDTLLEDTITDLFARMYRDMFSLQPFVPEGRWFDVAYTDFVAQPVARLREIYTQLELPGLEEALPRFEAYAAGQRDYVKNRFDYAPSLIRKVNDKLGFYFEHYGYAMKEG